MLDEQYGPQNGGCGNCPGLVTIARSAGATTYSYDCDALGHTSKFVQPGARRIASTTYGPKSIEDVRGRGGDVRVAVTAGAASPAVT